MTLSPCSPGALRRRALILPALVAAGVLSCDPVDSDQPLAPTTPAPSASAAPTAEAALAQPTVFATGLKFPRGFTFGPDGSLYVAEAGSGGRQNTKASQ